MRGQLAQHPGQRAEMVLVAVRDDDRLDVARALAQVGEVGQDEVDADHLGRREAQPDVDDDDPLVVLDDGHVLADLPQAAEGQDAQRGAHAWGSGCGPGFRSGMASSISRRADRLGLSGVETGQGEASRRSGYFLRTTFLRTGPYLAQAPFSHFCLFARRTSFRHALSALASFWARVSVFTFAQPVTPIGVDWWITSPFCPTNSVGIASLTVATAADSNRERCISETCTRGEAARGRAGRAE